MNTFYKNSITCDFIQLCHSFCIGQHLSKISLHYRGCNNTSDLRKRPFEIIFYLPIFKFKQTKENFQFPCDTFSFDLSKQMQICLHLDNDRLIHCSELNFLNYKKVE